VLDVYTIISQGTPRDYVDSCRDSIARAVAQAPFPVTVIEVPGVPGSIGQARANCMQRGSSPYVTWVDDDDYVLPESFNCLARHFIAQPCAIYAREIELLANGRERRNFRRHHLSVFHRAAIAPVALADYPAAPNQPLHDITADGVDELSWVYVHRIYRSAGMALRIALQHEAQRWAS
jgi:hypothetical protein